MPSGPIQAGAPGLLALLGLKNGGVLPPAFGDMVAPTLDIFDFYSQETENISTNVITPGIGHLQTLLAQVPQNELWYVHSLSARVILGAASVGRIYVHCIQQSGTAFFDLYSPGQNAVGNELLATSLRDFWAPGGSSLFSELDQTVAAPGNLLVAARVFKIRLP